MSRKPTIYWARPITTYSRTHIQAIQKHQSGAKKLTDSELKIHCELLPACAELEVVVYQHFHRLGYNVVDPGSDDVANAFEAWKEQPMTDYYEDDNGELPADVLHELYLSAEKQKKNRCKNPMPFFTDLAESCDEIVFSCFDDHLQSQNAPHAFNRIGCGVVKEVNAWAQAKGVFNISTLAYGFATDTSDSGSKKLDFIAFDTVRWPSRVLDGDTLCNNHVSLQSVKEKMFHCLDYPQTKALLLLQGYKSRSSKHKSKDK